MTATYAGAAMFLAALVASAEALPMDGPCYDDGNWVMCEKEGFNALTKKCRGFKRAAEDCEVEVGALREYVKALEGAVIETSGVCPTCQQPVPPKVQSGQRQVWGFALGLVGASAIMIAPLFPQMGIQAQTATVIGGLLTLSTGFIVNLTFD